MIYKIYTLSCPIDLEVKYVGCSRNVEARYRVHASACGANNRMKPWLLGLREAGLQPILGIYFETEDLSVAVEKEREAFEFYQKGQMLSINPKDRKYKDWRLTYHLPLKTIKPSFSDYPFANGIIKLSKGVKTRYDWFVEVELTNDENGSMRFIELNQKRFLTKKTALATTTELLKKYDLL